MEKGVKRRKNLQQNILKNLKKQLNDDQMLVEEQKRYKRRERDEFKEIQELRKREDEQWLEKIRQGKLKLRDTMYSQMEKSIERKKQQAEAQKKLDIEYVQMATNESISERKANADLKNYQMVCRYWETEKWQGPKKMENIDKYMI
ncbi:hypothetical protein AAG570_008278 [Ranatra chinensis]|uniref:Trichohyalin-plectin-homology domain-containing protein n=1 Tax=Ranatra chinensis TaxID=642074 RepID=A0ABD0XSP8_9HEMI